MVGVGLIDGDPRRFAADLTFEEVKYLPNERRLGPTQGCIDDDDDDPFDIDLGEDDDFDDHEDEDDDDDEDRCLYGAEALAHIQQMGMFGGRFNGLSMGDPLPM